jgi:hypothetical protein
MRNIQAKNKMKLLALASAVASLVLSLQAPAPAPAAGFEEFGIEALEAESSSSLAGAHPDFTANIIFNHREEGTQLFSNGATENAGVGLPPGMVGNVNNVKSCANGQFQAQANCPIASQVGLVQVQLSEFEETQVVTEPLYNLEPNDHEVARLGFWAVFFPIRIDVSVRTGGDYGITATAHQSSGASPVVFAKTIVWGDPADPIHDPNRLTQGEAEICFAFGEPGIACLTPEKKRESGLSPAPFLSNPVACQAQQVNAAATSYQLPGQRFFKSVSMTPITGCKSIPFAPSLEVQPTSHQAGAPTGLSAKLRIPQNNDVNLPSTSPLKDAKVILPEGMAIAAGAADGLLGCSAAQVGYQLPMSFEAEEEDPPGEAHCPAAAKIGTATFISPALTQPLHGAIYQRAPGEAPYLKVGEEGQLFGMWLVIDELGLHIKIPGVIKANKQTGRLTTTFTETPQLPLEEIDLELKDGPRAPLKNPDACGTYVTGYEFTPWSGSAPISGDSSMTINEGCHAPGFAPSLAAGSLSPVAGAFSPFTLTLRQESGEQNLARLTTTLPEGLLAKLAGVPLCPEAQVAGANCPATSQVGTTTVATGPGASPLWIPQPGKAPTAVYLAGPYKGDPYSLVVKTPAQAGPFDLGTVIVRAPIHVDPYSAQASITTDPLPQILEGVPVSYRTIHVDVNRPEFILNPTDCEAMAVGVSATSIGGALANLSNRFQVGDCARLGFQPTLKLSLRGATRRSGHPALKAVVTYPKQGAYANIASTQVGLPHSEFLDQGNLDKVCTQPQLLSHTCPASSVYGKVKAWTPLLDEPLEGPVYLGVGFGHNLPDLVAELNGQLRVLLHGRVDTTKQDGIRNTFEAVPDAPVSRFVLELKGGKKYGLLENSENICAKTQLASATFGAQNGASLQMRPKIANSCGTKARKAHKRQR